MRDAAFPSTEPATLLVQDARHAAGAVVPPIYQTSLFTFRNYAEMRERFAGRSDHHVYSRGDNPTVQEFEHKICRLEGGEAARAVASGMAAISGAVLSQIEAGDRILCVRNVYPDAYRLFELLLSRLAVTVDYVDGTDLEEVDRALVGARLLYLECPTTMMFEPLDLPGLTALARKHGAVTIADNSWATPINLRPLSLGVDMVVHSASKYISGHSDTVAGVIVSSRARMAEVERHVYPLLGAKLAPMEAWLLLRGMRTLPLRMARHRQSAAILAERLAALSAVTEVRLPTPAAIPGLDGASGLFSFRVGPAIDIEKFCDSLRLIKLGISWGGHESLVVPTAIAAVPPPETANSIRDFAVPRDMIRLSVGLEDVEDLWADLGAALTAAGQVTGR